MANTIELDRETTLESVRAYRDFEMDRDRQMPDPLGHADLEWWTHRAPKLQPLLGALERGHFLNPAGAEWGSRKHDRSPRRMVEHNEFAELYVRLALTPSGVAVVERQSSLVLAGRLLREPRKPGRPRVLTTMPHRTAHSIFRLRKRDLIRRDPPVGIKTDIRSFYPSVRPQVVEDALRPLVGASVAADVRLTLEKYAIDSGVRGLPIGPESSAWIANAVLTDGDRTLERHIHVTPLRWMDDLYQLDGSPAVVESCHNEWVQSISERGLGISLPKTKRSWEHGISGGDLLSEGSESHGDIAGASRERDGDVLAGKLQDELRLDTPNPSRLNHLFGAACDKRVTKSQLTTLVVDYLIDRLEKWECSCPRAVAYLKRYASAEQRVRMITAALSLVADGLAASEQVIALCRAATHTGRGVVDHQRGPLARALLDLARATDCVPLRTRARYAAWLLDSHYIERQTIVTGEFGDLHPFEQRVAIAFADPRRYAWWLRKEIEQGRWPITAEWRLNTR